MRNKEISKPQIKDLSTVQLRRWLAERGYGREFRVTQINEWLFRHMVTGFPDMTTLPSSLRKELKRCFLPYSIRMLTGQSARDKTEKFLLELPDGETVETVRISSANRSTVCVSSQVGCPVRCAFCASGKAGFVRNLTPGEIIDQVIFVCRESGEMVSNIVVMGMGEPLLNVDNLCAALLKISSPKGMGIGARRITVSTSGIVPGIHKLAEMDHQWNLALSLHTADEVKRREVIPDTHRFPLSEILEACRLYRDRTNRMITVEYVLIPGWNDGGEDITGLAKVVRDLKAKVNLIGCNPIAGNPETDMTADVTDFAEQLTSRGIRVTVRTPRGKEITAACGQLRQHHRNSG